MSKSNRIKDAVLVVFIIAAVAAGAHFVVSNPLGPDRLWFYIQGPIVQFKTRCSSGSPDWMLTMQRYATRNMAAPASQLAYVNPDDQLYHCESGWNDGVFGEQLLSPRDRFRYASATKTVTAAAIIDLVNSGQLSLKDTIISLLELDGELKDPRIADITIEHLLSHRGGWDRERTQDVMFHMGRKPWCPRNLDKLMDSTLKYSPGETELYSNLGYCLLGQVIEKVTGQPFKEYMADHYDFDDSNLAFVEGPFLADEVKYDFRFENFYSENYHNYFDFNALASSAGLSGSASDLAKLISQALKAAPLTILSGDMENDCASGQAQSCYGYGVFRYQPNETTMPLYIHGGKLPGNPTAIIIDPHGGVLVWLGAGGPRPGTNASQQFYDYIRETLVDYYDWQPKD